SLALKSWDRVGAAGSWLVLGAPEDQLSMAAYVCEIGAGKSTKPQRHLFEELIFVLSGSGGTTVWNDGAKSASFEWKGGSTFSADQCLASTPQPLGNGAGALRRGRPTHSHRCVREKNRFAAEAERHCFGHARIKGWRRLHEGEQSGVDSGDTENIEA